MSDQAFIPQSNTFNVTTSGTTLTPLSQVVSFSTPISGQPAAQASGLSVVPPQARIVNTSTGIVYVSITGAPRTAAIPGPSTPSLEIPIAVGTATVISLNQYPAAGQPQQLYINTIAVGTSAALNVTFGEGR
jgi:hypothetical protein